MGPRLIKISGKETEYSLRALPIGGYVRFLGEDESSNDPKPLTTLRYGSGFGNSSRSCDEYVLAVLLLSILFISFGLHVSISL